MERAKDIIIYRKNHSTVSIQCSESITRELYNYFSAYATNYRFAPLYKSKQWDGKIRFFSFSNNELSIGLVDKLYEFAIKGKYTIECTYERFNTIDRNEFKKFVDSLNLPFETRDYQFEAAYQAVCKKNLNIHASTASGKSLIIYIVCRFMQYIKEKVLIIVPQVQLVEQLFSDFESYGWQPEKYCHRLYEGQKKFYDSPVIISCWQSLITTKVKQDNPYHDFGCLIIDEAHGAKSKSISDLSKLCINAEYRFGFSGTYPENTIADWYTIVGTLGSIVSFATYKKLQEDGHITPLKIFNIILNYDKEFKKKVYNECGVDYKLQCDMIHNNENRNLFILKMVQNLKENCLVLFTKKEAHGYVLKELFERELKDKTIVYIDGDVPIEEREEIRKMMEIKRDVVLLGTYGCMSTGTNIKNLHHIIFASGYKSRTKTLQSIGRGLRLHKSKDFTRLYDIVDDVSFLDRNDSIRFVNHSIKHYKERSIYYQEENWDVKTIKYNI